MNPLKTETVSITPEMAKAWLCKNQNNRTINKGRVNAYAEDMKAGRWMQTHQGISFYSDGILADGQHRLEAIVKSGVAIESLVVYGLSRESGAFIDSLQARKDYQSAKIAGIDWLNKNAVAITKVIMGVTGSGYVGHSSSVIEEAKKHKESILFSLGMKKNTGKRGLSSAIVMGAISCAYYEESNKDLARFYDVLISGISKTENDVTIIKLRDFIIGGNRQDGAKLRKEATRKTMRAIKAYCSMTPLSRIKDPGHYIYIPFSLTK